MSHASKGQTKAKIVSAAWKLFYRYGYDNTTIDDIVEASGTSKGSFYHYFKTKDDLLASLSYLFDDKYNEMDETMDPEWSTLEKLIFMNQELFFLIENTVPVTLLSQLFSAQLITKGERHMLDPDRTYYRKLREVIMEGQNQNLFRQSLSLNDIINAYATFERGMMYDWCLANGSYSLCQTSHLILPLFLQGLCAETDR